MITPRHKVGDRVWTGTFTRNSDNELRVSIRERVIISVLPNYLKSGLHYGAVTVEHVNRPEYGMAWKPERLFDTEDAARMNVREQIERELRALNSLLGELPNLEPGKIHRRNT